jgi:hypothetical protein
LAKVLITILISGVKPIEGESLIVSKDSFEEPVSSVVDRHRFDADPDPTSHWLLFMAVLALISAS